jgi:hypothetical protein
LWLALLGGSFVFLNAGPSILFLLVLGALVYLWLPGLFICREKWVVQIRNCIKSGHSKSCIQTPISSANTIQGRCC